MEEGEGFGRQRRQGQAEEFVARVWSSEREGHFVHGGDVQGGEAAGEGGDISLEAVFAVVDQVEERGGFGVVGDAQGEVERGFGGEFGGDDGGVGVVG